MYIINNIIILILLSFLLLSLSFPKGTTVCTQCYHTLRYVFFLHYIMPASEIHSEKFKMLEEKPI